MNKLWMMGVAAAALFVAQPASATLQIAADINGAGFFCADNSAGCDTSPVGNVIITNNATLDGILFSSSSTSSASGSFNFLNASNLVITNTNATPVDVTITVSNTGFTEPVKDFQDASSGVWQGPSGISTATFKWWIDAANAQGADNAFDTPGLLVDSALNTSAGPVLSFSRNNASILDTLNAPFSMTEQVTLHLAAGESLVNRGQTIVGAEAVIPESSTWAMLGIGFGLMALIGVRKRKDRLNVAF